MEGKKLEHHDLGGVALGRRHADLRAGPCVEDAVGLAGEQRVDDIGHSDGLRAAPACLAQGVKGVDRLARLADSHDEGVLAQDRVPVTELAGDLDLGWHPGPMLEGDAAAQAGVVGRAAAHEHDALYLLEVGPGEPELLELGRAVGVEPAHEGVRQRPRLLVDLLRHEVVVAVPARGDEIPSDFERHELAPGAVETDDGDRVGPDLRDLVVRELVQRPRRAQEGR